MFGNASRCLENPFGFSYRRHVLGNSPAVALRILRILRQVAFWESGDPIVEGTDRSFVSSPSPPPSLPHQGGGEDWRVDAAASITEV